MKVLFRADASVQIGTGHVMRCLTLARELRALGADVTFASREHEGHLFSLIETQGFHLIKLPYSAPCPPGPGVLTHASWLGVDWQTDAAQLEVALRDVGLDWDLLVVDHYALDARWEIRLAAWFKALLVIDDLADRPHVGNLLLDQNLYADAEARYGNRIPPSCVRMLGPHYALLRPEFREMRAKVHHRSGSIKRLSICFGGVDPFNETAKAMRAVQSLQRPDLQVEVITSSQNPNLESLRNCVLSTPNASLVVDARDMAARFAWADFALGAAGSTSWERACLGVPALLTAFSLNQEAIGEGIDHAGAAIYLGTSKQATEAVMAAKLEWALDHPDAIRQMGERAFNLVDGDGTRRVAMRLLEPAGPMRACG